MTDIVVVVDVRELKSGVVRELGKLGCSLKIQTIEVSDYVVSDRCAFERKDIDDFFNSLFRDRKLFSQLIDLASAYERPILLFEGGDPFFSGRRVSPKAVQGILSAIALMRIPILYSLNAKETAEIIFSVAKKEQETDKRPFNPHGSRSKMSLKEQQEYVISAIPEVGPVVARNLLRHFGSVVKVMTANAEQLMEVEKVGTKTVQKIKEVINGAYNR